MAELSSEDRAKVWRGLMRHWSSVWEQHGLVKDELLAAVNATDTWIENNQSSYNSALPAAAQAGLNAAQKTLLFCAVALARVSIPFLRRILGEVD